MLEGHERVLGEIAKDLTADERGSKLAESAEVLSFEHGKPAAHKKQTP